MSIKHNSNKKNNYTCLDQFISNLNSIEKCFMGKLMSVVVVFYVENK